METCNTYVFDCPVHGNETSALCFRAFEEENKHLWQKHEVTSKRVDMPEDELADMLAKLYASLKGKRII